LTIAARELVLGRRPTGITFLLSSGANAGFYTGIFYLLTADVKLYTNC